MYPNDQNEQNNLKNYIFLSKLYLFNHNFSVKLLPCIDYTHKFSELIVF